MKKYDYGSQKNISGGADLPAKPSGYSMQSLQKLFHIVVQFDDENISLYKLANFNYTHVSVSAARTQP